MSSASSIPAPGRSPLSLSPRELLPSQKEGGTKVDSYYYIIEPYADYTFAELANDYVIYRIIKNTKLDSLPKAKGKILKVSESYVQKWSYVKDLVEFNEELKVGYEEKLTEKEEMDRSIPIYVPGNFLNLLVKFQQSLKVDELLKKGEREIYEAYYADKKIRKVSEYGFGELLSILWVADFLGVEDVVGITSKLAMSKIVGNPGIPPSLISDAELAYSLVEHERSVKRKELIVDRLIPYYGENPTEESRAVGLNSKIEDLLDRINPPEAKDTILKNVETELDSVYPMSSDDDILTYLRINDFSEVRESPTCKAWLEEVNRQNDILRGNIVRVNF